VKNRKCCAKRFLPSSQAVDCEWFSFPTLKDGSRSAGMAEGYDPDRQSNILDIPGTDQLDLICNCLLLGIRVFHSSNLHDWPSCQAPLKKLDHPKSDKSVSIFPFYWPSSIPLCGLVPNCSGIESSRHAPDESAATKHKSGEKDHQPLTH